MLWWGRAATPRRLSTGRSSVIQPDQPAALGRSDAGAVDEPVILTRRTPRSHGDGLRRVAGHRMDQLDRGARTRGDRLPPRGGAAAGAPGSALITLPGKLFPCKPAGRRLPWPMRMAAPFFLWMTVVAGGAGEDEFLGRARQLTFEGRRAGEGYFSADGRAMVFQSERDPVNPFFQIFLLDLETGDTRRISPGSGKTTCAWVHPREKKVLFASTHEDPQSKTLQERELAERAAGKMRRYSWDYDEHFDIHEAGFDGSNPKNLTRARGYDAEGAWSPDGSRIVFASNRAAYAEPLDDASRKRLEIDRQFFIDIHTMAADGSDVRRLTATPGYDGGPFFSADGRKICWRRFNETGEKAEVWTMNADGSDQRQITRLDALSWAPFFHPSGDYLVFSTNRHGFDNFELYLVDAAGSREPVRVTTTDGFDSLASFSPDGKTLTWTSNRTADKTSQIFLATWNHQHARQSLGLGASSPPSDSTPDVRAFDDAISSADLKKHVEFLASEALDGRMTGTPGEQLATQYVADVFGALGLQPAGGPGSWFLPFEFTAGVELGPGNALLAGEEPASPKKDWVPVSFSEYRRYSAERSRLRRLRDRNAGGERHRRRVFVICASRSVRQVGDRPAIPARGSLGRFAHPVHPAHQPAPKSSDRTPARRPRHHLRQRTEFQSAGATRPVEFRRLARRFRPRRHLDHRRPRRKVARHRRQGPQTTSGRTRQGRAGAGVRHPGSENLRHDRPQAGKTHRTKRDRTTPGVNHSVRRRLSGTPAPHRRPHRPPRPRIRRQFARHRGRARTFSPRRRRQRLRSRRAPRNRPVHRPPEPRSGSPARHPLRRMVRRGDRPPRIVRICDDVRQIHR